MLLYFLHVNCPTKALYEIGAVHGPLKEELEELLTKQTSEYKRLKDLEKILKEEKTASIWELFQVCLRTKNMDLLKKYQLIFTKLIDESRRNM